MAKKVGFPHNFYVVGHDLSADIAVINRCGSPRQTLDVPGMNSSAMERLLAHGNGELDFNSWFDDAALLEHAVLSNPPTGDRVACWFLGTSLDDQVAMISGKQINHDQTRGADGSLASTTQILGSGAPLEWGNSLTAGKVTHSSAGSTTGSVGDQSTAGAAIYLHIFSLSSGTPTVTVQDSSNTTNGIDGAWTTLKAFTIQSKAGERVTISGTVEKGLRVTTSGTFSNLVFAAALRRGEAVDDAAYA